MQSGHESESESETGQWPSEAALATTDNPFRVAPTDYGHSFSPHPSRSNPQLKPDTTPPTSSTQFLDRFPFHFVFCFLHAISHPYLISAGLPLAPFPSQSIERPFDFLSPDPRLDHASTTPHLPLEAISRICSSSRSPDLASRPAKLLRLKHEHYERPSCPFFASSAAGPFPLQPPSPLHKPKINSPQTRPTATPISGVESFESV